MDDQNELKKKRRWPKRILLLLFAVLLLLGLLFAAMQTPPAKRFMAARITSALSASLPWPVEIQGIRGFLPFVASVDTVRLGEAEDPWLDLKNATVSLNVLPLARGNVSIDRIGAELLTVHQIPESEDVEEPEPDEPFALPVLENLPDWIRLGQVQVDRVVVGEAVLGQEIIFDLGGAYLPEDEESVQLRVRGLDDTDAEVSLTGGIRDGNIDLRLETRDATVLPALANIEEPIAFTLTIKGPFSGAKVDLEAQRGDEPLASLDLVVAYPEPLAITGTGEVSLPEDRTPAAVLEKLGTTLKLELDLALNEGESLSIEDTHIAFEHGALVLDGRYDLTEGAVDLRTVVQHDDFHLLTGQVREGEAVAMSARIPLQGTLRSLSIQPEMDVGGEHFLRGDLTLGLGTPLSAKGTVTLQPAMDMTPPDIKTLLADGAHISLDVTYADGNATFEDTQVRVGETFLSVTGQANTASQQLDIAAHGSASDLAEFQGLADRPLAGAVSFEFTAKGDATQTAITGAVRAADIHVNTVQIPEGQLGLDITAGAFPDGLTNRIEATLSGAFPGFQPQPDLPRDLNLSGTILLEELQRLTVNSLDISDGNLAILANGTIDLETRNADFSGTVDAEQLGDYATIANLPYRGAAHLETSVTSGDTPGSIDADIQGTLKELSGLPEPAGGLLGDTAELHIQGRYDGERASLESFALSSEELTVAGSGAYRIEDETLDAAAEGELASLLPLSTLAGRPLSGAATFSLEASGPRDALSVQGTITGSEWKLDVLVADSAEIVFNASGVPSAISAQAQVSLEQAGETLDMGAELAIGGSRITIDGFQAMAGGNTLRAQGVFDTTTLRGHGKLNADAPDLGALNTWLQMPLGGSLRLEATLAEDDGGLTGRLDAENLVADSLRLGKAEGVFQLNDVFGAPSGTVTFTATELDAGQVDLASLTLSADGPPSGMAFEVKTEGVFQEFTRFKMDSGGIFSNESLALDLRDLNFGIEGFTFVLQDPAQLQWQEGVATLTPLVLTSESGTLRAAGEYSSQVVDATLELADVSLGLVELAGIDPMDGVVSGTITLTGTPAEPVLAADTKVSGYRPTPDETIPGLDAQASARVAGGAFAANFEAAVADAAAFQGHAELPVAFTLSPFVFAAPDNGQLTGALKGNADLGAISPLLPLEGHALDGALEADFEARGTARAPRITGAATVADGYYENGATSTILNDLAIRLEAQGDTLQLTEFSGNDGAGGTVRGEGQMVFRPDAGSPYDFTLTLDKPRLVYRDDMRAEGSGKLRFHGDSSGAELTGDVSVSPAYFIIPESSGETKVTTVEFREAGASSEEEDEEAAIFDIALDMTVDLPGRIFVAGTGLDSEWEGNLKVKNTTAAPAIEGVLRVKKGNLDFLGRLFNLADSTITFDGQTPPAPYLRIDAVTETEDIVAHVRMEGVADSLNISLDSEPSLPQDEILARVLFGQRLSDVSPVQALTLARYAPIFKKNQSGRSVLGSQGPKPFLVDRVSLRSGTGAGDASIATGKYLNDDFYLEYEQGLGAAESLISLEWLFAPQWSLKGKTTSQGQGGLGVFWKKDY